MKVDFFSIINTFLVFSNNIFASKLDNAHTALSTNNSSVLTINPIISSNNYSTPSNLTNEEFILKSISEARAKYETGINISKWQGKINGRNIHEDGVNLVVIRSTKGGTYQDPKFSENWEIVSNNTMKLGAFHNLIARITPEQQLQNINSQLQKVNFDKKHDILAVSLPASGNNHATNEQLTDTLHGLLILLKEDGYTNLYINTNNNQWSTHINSEKYDFAQFKLWITYWTNNLEPKIPKAWKDIGWDLWQYTCKGEVDGIAGHVCMNHVKKPHIDIIGNDSLVTEIN